MRLPWGKLLALSLLGGCTSAASEPREEARSNVQRTPSFERIREALLTFAAPLGARDNTSLVIELDETRRGFYAKADAKKPTEDETARGIQFRRRIVIGSDILSEPHLTNDGLALVLCHELGHHYGGYPFEKSDKLTAAEGSADYFATRVCGPALLRALEATDTPPHAKGAEERCRTSVELELCARLVTASLALVNVLHSHGSEQPETIPPYASTAGPPSLEGSDTFEVERTVAGRYPSLQCRLDTLVRGTLCGLASDPKVVDVPADTESEALTRSCSVASFESGARPACWFREGSIPTGLADPTELVWRRRK